MRSEVRYLMSGIAHLPYLVVSLFSLRRHYDGVIKVYAYPESIDIVETISSDAKVDIEAIKWQPRHRDGGDDRVVVPPKNGQFINKIIMMSEGLGAACYIDADTIFSASPEPLIDMVEMYPFVATQFCDWVTTGSIISNRVKRLKNLNNIDQSLVDEVLSKSYPSPNGGIFACRNNAPILSLWYAWTLEARNIFIADETILQLLQLYPQFYISKEQYNVSPKYGEGRPGVKIWHGHGDSFARPEKSKYGWELWRKEFDDCYRRNVGRMRDWFDKTVADNKQGNKWLRALLKS